MPNEQLDRVTINDSDPRVPLACERILLVYVRTQIAWVIVPIRCLRPKNT
jgi:uncharacterized membrane protein YidH (DUF202 family)